jgi:thioredoxin reductase
LAAYGPGRAAVGLALALRTWTAQVTACTDGRGGVRREDREQLAAAGIALRPERVVRLEARDGKLDRVVFESGPELPCHGLFFNTGQVVRSELATRLGCTLNRHGGVRTSARQHTDVPGLFLAGDAAREVQFVVVAAAEGATAGVAINRELQDEDRSARASGCPTGE